MQEHLTKLINNNSGEQRTDDWHTRRSNMLTASDIYKGLATATPSMKYDLIMSKLKPRVQTGGGGVRALVWGTRLESVAKEIIIKETTTVSECKIVDLNCVQHPTYTFLGASPDGVLLCDDITNERYGRLVELKCPISRVFSETTPIPDSYIHQMQLQLHCTNLTECEYIETAFKLLNYANWADTESKYKSFYAVHGDTGQVKYKLITDSRDVATWRKEEINNDPEMIWQLFYWVYVNHRNKLVKRDDEWLTSNIESLTEVWNTVLDHRKNGTFPVNPLEKTILTL